MGETNEKTFFRISFGKVGMPAVSGRHTVSWTWDDGKGIIGYALS